MHILHLVRHPVESLRDYHGLNDPELVSILGNRQALGSDRLHKILEKGRFRQGSWAIFCLCLSAMLAIVALPLLGHNLIVGLFVCLLGVLSFAWGWILYTRIKIPCTSWMKLLDRRL